MNSTVKNFLALVNKDLSYGNPATKDLFHTRARKLLKQIGTDLNLTGFDLHSNKGGIAVSGEVTLHSETCYIQISQPAFSSGEKTQFLVRTCKSKRDYSGGTNNFFGASELENYDDFISDLRKVLQL